MVKMLPFASLSLCLLISCLTITPGVWGTWVVTMDHYSICAVTGSSVEMPCTFTHHHKPDLKVNKVFWGINAQKGVPLTDLLENPQYKDRVQYKPDKKETCTLILSNVSVTDTAGYYARIETTTDTEKWLSHKVNLTVKDIFVNISGPAIEGKDVKLSCKSHCNLIQSSIILWKKNGANLLDTTTNSHDLILHNIKMEDEGLYSCAVKDKAYHPSSPVKLDVMYLPKNTSVSLSPAGEIFEGYSVNLTCNSDAKPPVKTYRWITTHRTSTSSMASEQIYRLLNISSKHSGLYYCVVKNQYGVGNSTAVRLDVQYAPRNMSASLSPSGEIVEGNSVILTCSSDANPPVQSYTWYKKEKSEPVISTQQVYSISRVSSEYTGYYYCQAKNKHGHSNSIVTHLDVLYPPQRTSASVNDTGDLEEGSSVTLTCSSDANPPVESFTWYRKTGDKTDLVGSAETITFTMNSNTAGLYHCEAKNRIASNNSPALKVSLAGSGWPPIAGGAVACVIVVIVVIAVLMSRRENNTTNSTSDFSSTARNSQGAADNDYVNVNPATPHPGQNVGSGDQDDVQYASVQFKRPGVQQETLYSSAQKPKPHTQQQQEEEEEVEYTTVNFSRPNAATHAGADVDVYSTVSKPRKKKA